MGQSIQEWTKWSLWKAAFKKFEVLCFCLSRPDHFKFFKACLAQISLGLFLNTLCHIELKFRFDFFLAFRQSLKWRITKKWKKRKSGLNSIVFLKNCRLDSFVFLIVLRTACWLINTVIAKIVKPSEIFLIRKLEENGTIFEIYQRLPLISKISPLSINWPENSTKYNVLLEGVFRFLLNIYDGTFCKNS